MARPRRRPTIDPAYYYTNSSRPKAAIARGSGGLCAGDANQVCRRNDACTVTTTYSYDAENRVTSKTYSDSTPVSLFQL
jgi:YD repeat-containing protein